MYNMEKQHKLGKLHALERICFLLDEDSFREIGSNITNLEDAFNIKKGQFPYDGAPSSESTIPAELESRKASTPLPAMVKSSIIIQWHPDTFLRFPLSPETVPVEPYIVRESLTLFL